MPRMVFLPRQNYDAAVARGAQQRLAAFLTKTPNIVDPANS